MISKVKIVAVLVVSLGLSLAGFLIGWRLQGNRCRDAELMFQLAEAQWQKDYADIETASLRQSLAALAEQKAALPLQTATWKKRATDETLPAPPPDCAACLAAVKREVEVRDREHGWWIYRDLDVLDDAPGTLTLTPRLFADLTPLPPPRATGPAPTLDAIGKRPGQKPLSAPGDAGERRIRLAPPERAVRAQVGLTDYELEFRYDPLRIEGPQATISVGLSSRLSLDRQDSALTGALSAGVEVSW